MRDLSNKVAMVTGANRGIGWPLNEDPNAHLLI